MFRFFCPLGFQMAETFDFFIHPRNTSEGLAYDHKVSLVNLVTKYSYPVVSTCRGSPLKVCGDGQQPYGSGNQCNNAESSLPLPLVNV